MLCISHHWGSAGKKKKKCHDKDDLFFHSFLNCLYLKSIKTILEDLRKTGPNSSLYLPYLAVSSDSGNTSIGTDGKLLIHFFKKGFVKLKPLSLYLFEENALVFFNSYIW